MTLQNLHAHTRYDDGRDTPRAMVEAALAAGLSAIGISLHSPLPFENGWAARVEHVDAYHSEMRALREEYAGRIDVYTGIEWDILSGLELLSGEEPLPAAKHARGSDETHAPQTPDWDYVIGSVHFLAMNNARCCVDKSAQTTREWLRDVFNGDADEAARRYFAQVGTLAYAEKVDIVGHFDLLTKFDEQERLFDANRLAYRTAARSAMERLCAAGKIFEINTGAISRGYRTTPYPSRDLLCELARMGGRVTMSADAHRAQDIAFGLEDAAALAKACGFGELWFLQGKEFVPVKL